MKPWVGVDEYFQKSSCFLALMLQGYKLDIILCPTHVPASCVLVHKSWMQLFSPLMFRFSRDPCDRGSSAEPGRVKVPRACFPSGVCFISGTNRAKKVALGSLQQTHDLSQDLWASLGHCWTYTERAENQKRSPFFSKSKSILSRFAKANPQKLCWA